MGARWVVGAVVLATAMMPTQIAVGAAPVEAPDRIELPDGWQPEGITAHRELLYVGSLADGAIWEADSATGEGRVFVEGQSGQVAVGVHFDPRRNLLWVAGGDTAELRAYDADSGELLRTYEFPSEDSRFLNDVAVLRGFVYVTDSLQQELGVVRLRGELPPPSAATTLPLTGDLEYGEGFNLNGIVRANRELFSVQSGTGLLFQIDEHTGETVEVDLGGELLTNGDGLESDHGIVYAVRNSDNLIAAVELAADGETGEVSAELTDDDLDVPTTVAKSRGLLWAVNARFSTPPTPETSYWITRLEKYSD